MKTVSPSPRLLACLLSAVVVSLCADHGFAQDSASTTSQVTQSKSQSSTDAALEQALARDWGLKAEEWARYRQLMRGPLGIYSPGLDPLTALGIEARTDEERRHFAQLQVQAEGRRTQKTLAYQRAYDAAWKELYPALRPLAVSADAASGVERNRVNASEAGRTGRAAVFVKDQCALCDQRVQQLQAAGHTFDIYMVGTQQDDTRIREWARRVGIEPLKVKARNITLNHDAGRWLSLGGKGDLPAVLVEADGQWQQE